VPAVASPDSNDIQLPATTRLTKLSLATHHYLKRHTTRRFDPAAPTARPSLRLFPPTAFPLYFGAKVTSHRALRARSEGLDIGDLISRYPSALSERYDRRHAAQ
jgi:hypothetical protein